MSKHTHKRISGDELMDLFKQHKEFYLLNEFEDIAYRVDPTKGKVRYFAKIHGTGKEFDVFTETSNCLMDALSEPVPITKEEYDKY